MEPGPIEPEGALRSTAPPVPPWAPRLPLPLESPPRALSPMKSAVAVPKVLMPVCAVIPIVRSPPVAVIEIVPASPPIPPEVPCASPPRATMLAPARRVAGADGDGAAVDGDVVAGAARARAGGVTAACYDRILRQAQEIAGIHGRDGDGIGGGRAGRDRDRAGIAAAAAHERIA